MLVLSKPSWEAQTFRLSLLTALSVGGLSTDIQADLMRGHFPRATVPLGILLLILGLPLTRWIDFFLNRPSDPSMPEPTRQNVASAFCTPVRIIRLLIAAVCVVAALWNPWGGTDLRLFLLVYGAFLGLSPVEQWIALLESSLRPEEQKKPAKAPMPSPQPAAKSAIPSTAVSTAAVPKKKKLLPKDTRGVEHLEGQFPAYPGIVQTDEMITPVLNKKIFDAGLTVVTTRQAGLQGADDLRQLDMACRARRCILTHDRGFKRMHHDGLPHAGIVLAPEGEEYHEEIVSVLLRLSGKTQG